MAANEKLMKAMAEALPFELPEGLKKAMAAGPDNFRRYAQDVARELQYQNLRNQSPETGGGGPGDLPNGARSDKRDSGDFTSSSAERKGDIESTANSHTAWKLVRALMELDQAYGEGDFDRAGEIIAGIGKIKAFN